MVNRCRGKETIRGCQERWNLRHRTYITLMSPAHIQSALVCSLPTPLPPTPTNLYLSLFLFLHFSVPSLSLALSSLSLSYRLPFSTVFTSISFFLSHPPSLSLVLPLLFLPSFFPLFSRHFVYLFIYLSIHKCRFRFQMLAT